MPLPQWAPSPNQLSADEYMRHLQQQLDATQAYIRQRNLQEQAEQSRSALSAQDAGQTAQRDYRLGGIDAAQSYRQYTQQGALQGQQQAYQLNYAGLQNQNQAQRDYRLADIDSAQGQQRFGQQAALSQQQFGQQSALSDQEGQQRLQQLDQSGQQRFGEQFLQEGAAQERQQAQIDEEDQKDLRDQAMKQQNYLFLDKTRLAQTQERSEQQEMARVMKGVPDGSLRYPMEVKQQLSQNTRDLIAINTNENLNGQQRQDATQQALRKRTNLNLLAEEVPIDERQKAATQQMQENTISYPDGSKVLIHPKGMQVTHIKPESGAAGSKASSKSAEAETLKSYHTTVHEIQKTKIKWIADMMKASPENTPGGWFSGPGNQRDTYQQDILRRADQLFQEPPPPSGFEETPDDEDGSQQPGQQQSGPQGFGNGQQQQTPQQQPAPAQQQPGGAPTAQQPPIPLEHAQQIVKEFRDNPKSISEHPANLAILGRALQVVGENQLAPSKSLISSSDPYNQPPANQYSGSGSVESQSPIGKGLDWKDSSTWVGPLVKAAVPTIPPPAAVQTGDKKRRFRYDPKTGKLEPVE